MQTDATSTGSIRLALDSMMTLVHIPIRGKRDDQR